jgi:hypothetical protein
MINRTCTWKLISHLTWQQCHQKLHHIHAIPYSRITDMELSSKLKSVLDGYTTLRLPSLSTTLTCCTVRVWYGDCEVVPSLGHSLELKPSRSISRSRVSRTCRHTPCDVALVTSTNMDCVFSEIYTNKIVGFSLSIIGIEKAGFTILCN